MNANVLLTGGFGNLGGRLSEHLSRQQEFKIRLGSRSNRSTPPWAPRATTVKLDVLDRTSLDRALSGVDVVVHLAAMNDVECARDPELAHDINVEGTRNLLDSGIASGVSRIIYISTAQVYGSPPTGTITEETNPNPQHPYGATHLEAEHLVERVHNLGRIAGIRIRCANGFGKPMDPLVNIWHILVNDLCRQATEFGTLTLKTHGDQKRNFVPLHDVSAAVSHLIKLDLVRVGDGLFNLGHNESLSVWEMTQRIANRCEAILGFTPPISRPPIASGELIHSLDFRSDKLLATGFVPRGDIDTEIDYLLRFCAKEFPHRT
ncbi:MAG: SDR family oxidoreductase [Ilumatobacteraceae bacterium]